jgi:hypothetical protein
MLLLWFLLGCGGGGLSPRELVRWVEKPENGLKAGKAINNYLFEAQYKPLDYIIAKEERKDELPATLVSDRKKALGNEMDYFNFRISTTEQGKDVISTFVKEDDPGTKEMVLKYLSYDIKDDFYLLDGQDTLKCLLFNHPPNYGLAPYLDFVMGFESRPGKDKRLVYDDKLLKTGTTQLTIKNENIIKTPTLKIERQ